MNPHKNLRLTASLAVSQIICLLTAITLVLGIYPTQTAQAIPPNQIACEDDEQRAEFVSDCGEPECFTRLTGQRLTVPAAIFPRDCVLTFSTEYSSPQPDVGLQLAYSVDGEACQSRAGPVVIAPALFDDPPRENVGTTTLVSHLPLDEKSHTIVPCIAQISPGAASRVGRRCVTIECRTF
jgi:hypothetical protein